MEFVNCTPHEIVLNNDESFPPSGTIARVTAKFTNFDSNGICDQKFGQVEGLPTSQDGVTVIVSSMVLTASGRKDLVAPATGHPDCVREAGRIKSVPGFVRG